MPGASLMMEIFGSAKGSQGHWYAGNSAEIIGGLKKQVVWWRRQST